MDRIMIGGFSDISKILLPIAQTAIPVILNKVMDSSTSSSGDYTPPTTVYQQPAPVHVTQPVIKEEVKPEPKNQFGDVNLTVNMTVFVVTDPGCVEKIKDMSFSKTFEDHDLLKVGDF